MAMELIDPDDCVGGFAGDILTFDLTPKLNPARVRPFIYAILLMRGAVRSEEVLSSIAVHAHPDDIRSWDSEATQAELVVSHAIYGLVKKNILRDRGDGLFVLSNSPEAIRTAISITSALDAQLPDHLLQEVGQQTFQPKS